MDFIDEFIKEYRNNPCLWNANSIHFKNKTKRQEAYMKLIDIASRHGEHYNIERTKQKINNLRCAFRHQLKKYTEFNSKTGRDEPYCPKRRYFESLMFLMEEENTTRHGPPEGIVGNKIEEDNCFSTEPSDKMVKKCLESSLEMLTPVGENCTTNTSLSLQKPDGFQIIAPPDLNVQESLICKEVQTIGEDLYEMPVENTSMKMWSEKTSISKLTSIKKSERVEKENDIQATSERNNRQGSTSPSSHFSNESDAYPVKCVKVDCTPGNFQKLLALACYNIEKPFDDKFTHFGKVVADKLRSLNPQQAVFAEKLIYDVLFQGHLGLLSASNVDNFSFTQ